MTDNLPAKPYALGGPDAETVTRLRQVMGESVQITAYPGLVAALASANPSAYQLKAVSQFVDSLALANTIRQVRGSGASVDLTDKERAYLDAVKEPFSDVDAAEVQRKYADQLRQAAEDAVKNSGEAHGVGGWFSRTLRRGTSLVFDNPVVRPVGNFLNRASDIVKTPFRMMGTLGPSAYVNPFTNQLHVSDQAIANLSEQHQAMKDKGYGSGFFDTLAFYSRGEQVYRNMDDLRAKYGGEMVDLAKIAEDDPEKFLDPNADLATLKGRMLAQQDPKFKELLTEIEARHISPGRDLAHGLGIRPGTAPFKLVSGTTDGVVSWYSDPFLIAGKAAEAGKYARRGLQSMTDRDGVVRIMTENGAIRRGYDMMLNDARTVREGTEAEAAAAMAKINGRTPTLLSLVDEINGKRAVLRDGEWTFEHGKPIENLGELTDYLANTNALVRLSNGMAASQAILMPGAVSRFGYRRLKGTVAGLSTSSKLKSLALDYTDRPYKLIATPDDAKDASGAATRGDQLLAYRKSGSATAGTGAGQIARHPLNYMRSRFEQISRRLSAVLPTTSVIDFYNPQATDQIRRFALTYMPRAEANRLAAVFTTGDMAAKRRVYKGVVEQIIHASGMETSASGRKLAEAMRSDLSAAEKQRYSTTDLDLIADDSGTRRVGLWPGQMSTEMWLPNFAEMQRVAAKTGAWDHTVGWVLTREWVDKAFSTVRTSWLITGAGALRNALDEIASFGMRPEGRVMVAARGRLSTRRGRDILRAELPDDGWEKLGAAQLARSLPDARKQLGAARKTYEEAPYGGASDAADRVKALRRHVRRLKVQSWFDRAFGATVSVADRVPMMRAGLTRADLHQYADELADTVGRAHLDALDGLGRKAPFSTVTAEGIEQARDIAEAGLSPRLLKFHLDGYDNVSADGEAGARAWSHNLSQRFGSDGLGNKVLELILAETPANRAALKDLIAGRAPTYMAPHDRYAMVAWLKDQGVIVPKGKRITAAQRHSYYAANPREVIDPNKALDHFRDSAEKLRFLKDDKLSPSVADKRLEDYVDTLGLDMYSMLHDRYGNVIEPLVDYLKKHKRAPTIDWIERNIPTDLRPEHAVGRTWVAVPGAPSKVAGLPRGYANTMSRAYDHVVSRPVSFMSRQPIYAVNYAYARKNLEGYEKELVAGGLSAERAAEVTQHLAHQHAWDRTTQIIDNPEVQSHFSVLSRNLVNFERATEQFLRRWGRTFKEDPTRVRKAQLLYQAAVHSGVIDYDANGQPIFVYPGSGAVINSMLKAANLLPGVDMVQLPTVPNLTSQVMFLNPSLDNPVQLSFSPIASMPTRVLSHLFPGNALGFSQIDQLMNGTVGAGRPWYQQFMPTVVNRFMQALSADDRKSQVASVVRNAVVNLDAAGKLPPPGASAGDVDAFIQRLVTQAKGQLVTRAVFSFFMPAAPSLPENTTAGGDNEADPLFQARGIRTLKEEYRRLINDLGFEKASAVWAATHPDDLAYTVGTTSSSAGTQVSPSDQTLRWMQQHRDLVKKYPNVAPYFIPEDRGEFSPAAWNAELAAGLRTYKDLGTFYRDVRTVTAERTYYAYQDQRDAELAAAHAAGDKRLVRQINENWSQFSQEFNSMNPLFREKQAEGELKSARKEAAIAQLQQMAQSGEITQFGGDASAAMAMLVAFNSHSEFQDRMSSRRDKRSLAQKAAEDQAYESYVQGVVQQNSALKDLYNGLFRSPGVTRLI